MILFDKLLVNGIGWVLRRVGDATDAQLDDEGTLREELLAAEMRYELGEIDAVELARTEDDLLARLRELRKSSRAAARHADADLPRSGVRYAVDAIEADTGDESPPQRRKRPHAKKRK